MTKKSTLPPATEKQLRQRLRQLMEAGNSTAQAAKRLKISNKDVLDILGEMRREGNLVITASMPTTIDPDFTPSTGKGPTPPVRTSAANDLKTLVSRSHSTPVYRRTCEDALALLNLETMSTESRIRLASQLISETLRRFSAMESA